MGKELVEIENVVERFDVTPGRGENVPGPGMNVAKSLLFVIHLCTLIY